MGEKFTRQRTTKVAADGFHEKSKRDDFGQSNALWLHHSNLRSDETWLPEWSGNPGRVQRWRSSVASGVFGKPTVAIRLPLSLNLNAAGCRSLSGERNQCVRANRRIGRPGTRALSFC